MNDRDGLDAGRSVRRWIRIAGFFLVAASLAVDASALQPVVAAPAPAKPLVEIKHHKYVPDTLTVPVGTKVTWINRDDDVHTVISTAEKFRSRGMDTDEQFSQTFTTPGTYEYFCTLHPLMKAKVIVK